MKKFFSNRKFNIIYSLIAIILMWAVWVIAYKAVGNSLIVPSSGNTFKEMFACFTEADFWLALGGSLWRTLTAFVISFVLAVVCAAPAYCLPPVRAALRPVMAFIRILPTVAAIVIILRWTETNKNIAPIIVTVLVLFPMIYAQILAAADGIDTGLGNFVKVYKIKRTVALFKIYLPAICPNILSQIGANISLGLKIMVSGEIITSTFGLGGLMHNANSDIMIARLAALTVITVLLGLIVDIAFSQLARVTYKWSRKEGAR